MLRIAIIAIALSLTGCATMGRALSITTCGVADERLGTIVRDPAAVLAYFTRVAAEGRRLAIAIKAGQPVGPEAGAWIADMMDLVDRMRRCIPANVAIDVELSMAEALAQLTAPQSR